MEKLLAESEAEFAKIVALLGAERNVRPYGPAYDAYVLAWRMHSRLEEARLRHPVI